MKRIILNLTQHPATPEQVEAGVVEPSAPLKERIQKLLTFDELPSLPEIRERARKLVETIDDYLEDLEKRGVIATSPSGEANYEVYGAMIGGAPYLMRPLEEELIKAGVKPLYAFSKRITSELRKPDGTVEKRSIFVHAGFIEVE
ncbi:MAG: hypothetical protein QXR81_07640 [Candidatus Nezhaarchaeales archaeon]